MGLQGDQHALPAAVSLTLLTVGNASSQAPWAALVSKLHGHFLPDALSPPLRRPGKMLGEHCRLKVTTCTYAHRVVNGALCTQASLSGQACILEARLGNYIHSSTQDEV